MTRLPILPTIIVTIAVAVMVSLGFWQLERKAEKEAILARYAQAQTMSAAVPFPLDPAEMDGALYRASSLSCLSVISRRTTPGRNADGRTGIAQMARCNVTGGAEAEIALGWTSTPQPVQWNGGKVTGFVGPAGEEARLIAAPPVAGLEPLALPDPADIPNNHLAYAGQWFFFALTALVIFILAVRRRSRGTVSRG